MSKKKIVILASGIGTLTQSIINAVESGNLKCDIAAIISDSQSPVLDRAAKHLIPHQVLTRGADVDAWALQLEITVAKFLPDLVVSAGFMKILPGEFVKKYRCINSHPSLLPRFPGAHAVRDALAAKVSQTGCTIHWIDAGIDTGAVISQIPIPIYAGDTEDKLHERIKIVERVLIVETLMTLLQ